MCAHVHAHACAYEQRWHKRPSQELRKPEVLRLPGWAADNTQTNDKHGSLRAAAALSNPLMPGWLLLLSFSCCSTGKMENGALKMLPSQTLDTNGMNHGGCRTSPFGPEKHAYWITEFLMFHTVYISQKETEAQRCLAGCPRSHTGWWKTRTFIHNIRCPG